MRERCFPRKQTSRSAISRPTCDRSGRRESLVASISLSERARISPKKRETCQTNIRISLILAESACVCKRARGNTRVAPVLSAATTSAAFTRRESARCDCLEGVRQVFRAKRRKKNPPFLSRSAAPTGRDRGAPARNRALERNAAPGFESRSGDPYILHKPSSISTHVGRVARRATQRCPSAAAQRDAARFITLVLFSEGPVSLRIHYSDSPFRRPGQTKFPSRSCVTSRAGRLVS